MREFIGLPPILDNVIADGTVAPLIAVIVDSAPDRGDWYQFNPLYLAYLERVVAYVDEHYPTRRRPDARLHLGSSAAAAPGCRSGWPAPT